MLHTRIIIMIMINNDSIFANIPYHTQTRSKFFCRGVKLTPLKYVQIHGKNDDNVHDTEYLYESSLLKRLRVITYV